VTPADRAKLARILGMLGSEHAGERASAALQAEAFRKRHGMTWEEMLALPAVDVVVETEPVWTPPPYVRPRPSRQRRYVTPLMLFAYFGAWTAFAVVLNLI